MKDFIQEIVKEGGLLALDYFGKELKISTKANKADLVTEADHAVDAFLVGKILNRFPAHHVYSEEGKERINPKHEFEWVIDPIDGTRNFASHIPIWCTMVCVLRSGEPILSAIFSPCTNDFYFAERGMGAFRNGRPICVGQRTSLEFGYGIIVNDVTGCKNDRFALASRRFYETKGWNHNHGTMLAACHVATGGLDFVCNNVGMDYDYLPPSLICSEAGARVTNIDGEKWERGMQDIAIAGPELHDKVLGLFAAEEKR